MQKNIINLITEKIQKQLQPQAIYLFGSYAYGTPTKDSDIDLLVVMDSTESKRQRQIFVRNMLRSIHCPKDILVRTPQEVDSVKDDKYAVETIAINKGKRIL